MDQLFSSQGDLLGTYALPYFIITLHADIPIKLKTRDDIENTLAAIKAAGYLPTFVHELSHYFLSVSTSAGLSEYIKLYHLVGLSGQALNFLRDNRKVVGAGQRRLPLIDSLRTIANSTAET